MLTETLTVKKDTDMTEKTVNYTAEQEARLMEVYTPSASQAERVAQVKALAEEMGKSTRSVIAKLTVLKVYVPKEYVTKKNEAPVRKEALVAVVEEMVGTELNGLEKATKATLNALIVALRGKAQEVEVQE
jgi:hypothetical protein